MKKKILVLLLVLSSIFFVTGCELFDKQDDGSKQYEIYQLALDSGYVGSYEEWLDTIRGADGKDGREIELDVQENKIVWRYVGDSIWTPIYSFDDLIGPNGQEVVSIDRIEKTKTEGLVDTYTIYYTNGKTTFFTVTNGSNGQGGGIEGKPGVDGHTPVITISDKLTWVIDGVDTNISVQGKPGEDGKPGQDGKPGEDGKPGQDGKSAYEIYLEKHPEYKGTEEQWLDDLVNGKLGTENKEDEKFTINFITNSETVVDSQEVYKHEKINKPVDPVKIGHTFLGWFVGDEKWVFSGYPVTCDLSLEAHWLKNEYTVTIDYNNGQELETQKVIFENTINLENPLRDGQVFDYWVDDNYNRIEMPYTVRDNVTIRAQYRSYIYLSFNTDGGNEIEKQSSYMGEYISSLPIPIKDGFVFLGWFYTENGEEKELKAESYNPFKNDITLKAHWSVLSGNYEYVSDENDPQAIKLTSYTGTDKEVIVPSTLDGKKVLTIGSNVFQNNPTISKLTVLNGIEVIEDNAFNNMGSLEEIILPKSIKTIGLTILKGNDLLKKLTLENICQFINLFGETENDIPQNLKTLKINEDNTYNLRDIKNRLFDIELICDREYLYWNTVEDLSCIETLVLPDILTKLNSNSISNCPNLKDIKFPANLKTIEGNAISECPLIKNPILPDTIENININYMDNLDFVILKNTIKNIAFSENGDYSTELIYFNGTEEEWNNIDKGNITNNTLKPIFNKDIKSFEYIQDKDYNYYLSNTNDVILSEYKNKVVSNLDLNNQFNGKNFIKIANRCFYNFKFLNTIIIPDTVKIIGDYAFYNCLNLQNVTLSKNLVTIGFCCFNECRVLNNINFPDTIRNIGESAFFYCEKMTSLVLPEGFETINEGAFEFCFGLKDIKLPHSLKTIKGHAFNGNNSLYYIAIPSGVEVIESNAFHQNHALKYVSLPSSIKQLGSNSFNYTTKYLFYEGTKDQFDSIKYFENDKENPNIKNNLFKYVEKINYESYVSEFSEFRDEKSNYIYTNNGEIFDYHITDCQNFVDLTNISEGKKLISIANIYFQSNDKAILLPNTVEKIEFDSDHKYLYNYIFFEGTMEQWNNIEKCKLKETYINKLYTDVNPNSFEYVNQGQFEYIRNVNEIILIKCLDKNITNIDFSKLFNGYKIKEIYGSCFNECNNIQTVNIDSIENWVNIDFDDSQSTPFNYETVLYINNQKVEDIVIPEGIKEIKDFAFLGFNQYHTITLPDSIEKIGIGAFSFNSGVNVANEFGNAYYFGSKTNPYLYLFSSNRNNYTDLVNDINPNCKIIGYNSINYLNEGANVYIPSSVTSISLNAIGQYNDSINLHFNDINQFITMDSSMLGYNSYINLYEKENLVNNLTITNLTEIPEFKFYKITNLENITIPEGVTAINKRAFAGCLNLKNISIPNSIQYIDEYAFDNCSNLVYNENENGKYLGNAINPYVALMDINNQANMIIINENCIIIPACFRNSNCDIIFIPKSVKYITNFAFYSNEVKDIYCEINSKPETWVKNFANYKSNIHWNSTLEQIA